MGGWLGERVGRWVVETVGCGGGWVDRWVGGWVGG